MSKRIGICIGFGERDGTCTNVAGTPWTPLWCSECDEARRAHITAQLEKITAGFAARSGGGETRP